MFCAFVAPSEVRWLTVTTENSTALSVFWDIPNEPNGHIGKYRVLYQVFFSRILCFSEHTFKLRCYCILQFL